MYDFEHRVHMDEQQLDQLLFELQRDPVLARTIWYDGAPKDLKNKAKEWWLVRVAGAGDRTVGVFWLNGYQGRTAQIHFAVFEDSRSEAVEIGKATMRWLDEQGWLHSVYGLTPATHRHVFPFITAIGFQILGRIPGACWVERKQRYIDGVASVYDFRRQG